MASVLIGADLCPIGENLPYFERGDAEALFHDLLPLFREADLVVANLECPLIEHESPIRKTGPIFGAPVHCVEALRAAGIGLINLANNHIMDHGEAGLRCTMEVCRRAGIATVGAGLNLHEAARPHVADLGGLKVGFVSVAEREFSIAGPAAPGANPLDVIDLVRRVRTEAHEWDHWIVLYHGAAEFQPVTPQVQRVCRFLVDLGATAVVVQHPHQLGGWEQYRHGYIVYGQGALVMDEPIYRDKPGFHEGFLVRLQLERGKAAVMDCIPFRQSKPPPGARLLDTADASAWYERMEARNRRVADPALVEDEWLRFCQENRHDAISTVLGHGRILRWLNRRGWVERLWPGERRMRGVRNMILCETHREMLQTVFDRWWYPPGGESS
ncbi:CapA family protein [Limisphaera ngatamarikiensis]|uniref:CapA family protein n=1 Tax=Limisphaera ngatamarikiensis TaxID=1324935 RepID=A0A6M1RNI9_9BACT|nr:CapA family protein [Limisphaera ngatamarikiensis]NGO39243.1 CapA family protein [Limisphaera ngatamarikiensis]